MLHRIGFLREDGFHLRGFHCVIHTVAAAGFHSLIQRDVARNGKHHVAGAVERIGAGVQQFGCQLGNALGGAGDIVPDGMAFIQAAEQCGQQPPIRAVVIHFDFLPDDALLLGDGLLGKPGMTDHVEQNIQVFIRHAGCGKNIAGAVIAGKSVCRSASFGIQVERIALLGFKHFVFQKVRGTGGQLDPFAVKGKFPHNGAKVGGVHGVYRAVARHSAAQNRQAAGQGHALAVDRPRGFFPDGSRAVFCVFHHAFSPSPFAVSV